MNSNYSNGNMTNQSTEKAFAVLEFLVAQRHPLKLLEIAKQMGMNASTVSRYISALVNCGYVEQDESNLRYSATTKICELANKLMSTFQLVPFAHPYVQRLSEYFSETACLVVERNSAALYVDIVVSASKSLINVQRVGNSAPLYCTAAGKMFLSQYSEEQFDRYISTHKLAGLTENTIAARDKLLEEVRRIRETGYSIDNEEIESGLRCVSVPVRDRNGFILACLSITGPAARLTAETVEEKKDWMLKLSGELSERLVQIGYLSYFNY